jgi:hypothetical protein
VTDLGPKFCEDLAQFAALCQQADQSFGGQSPFLFPRF